MKTLTYISKYHFIRMASLLITLMWQVNVQAQADSTVTYTFNDTTMTFNLNEVRTALLEHTDLSPEEVEATLQYELFWKSMFPPVESSHSPKPINNERIQQDGCIGFADGTPAESEGNNPVWVTQAGCIGNDEVGPITYTNVDWTSGIQCTHTLPYFESSYNAFTIIESTPDGQPMQYDPLVTRNNTANVIEMKAPSGNSHFIRIGDQVGGYHAHRIIGTFTVPQDKPLLKYYYALALQDTDDMHGGGTIDDTGRPYFTMRFRAKNPNTNATIDVPCGGYSVVGVDTPNSALDTDNIRIGQNVGDDSTVDGEHWGAVIDWQENIIDLSEYIGWEVEIEASVTECNRGGHTAWAYLDFSCEEGAFEVTKDGGGCTYDFTTTYTGNYGSQNTTYDWTFSDITGNVIGTSTDTDPSFTYDESGEYNVDLTITYTNFPNGNDGGVGEECTVEFSETLTICCDFCESSFAPLPGDEYVISAWVKEIDPPNPRTYDSPNITLFFDGPDTQTQPFTTSGAIIDGWQRIEAEFTVPADAKKIKIQLNNSSNDDRDVFFDDVRIHPFDASMKSFVYDPVTLRLSAELDERNYATYYEYDEEGALIRIKKETERGVMTIQEARNGIRKGQ